jgi:hypothetical protein
MDDISGRITYQLLTVPAIKTGTVTSDACNVQGYEGAAFCAIFGNSSDVLSGTLYWSGKLTECDTEGGSYTDVATEDIQIAATNSFAMVDAPTEDQACFWIGYGGSKKYVKVVITATGTHAVGTIISIVALLGMPRTQTEGGAVNP